MGFVSHILCAMADLAGNFLHRSGAYNMKRITCVLRAAFACLLLMLIVQPGAWAVPGDIGGNGTDEPDGFVGINDLNRVLGHWG